jgi:hypothetical protein
MSDGTSCGIFAELFHRLEVDGITAKWLFNLSKDYDFNPRSMEVDDILAKYDLVRIEWNEQFECWEVIYADDSGFEDAEPWSPCWWTLPPPNGVMTAEHKES